MLSITSTLDMVSSIQRDNVKAGDGTLLGECLPGMHKALGSVLSTAQKQCGDTHIPVIPALGRWVQEVTGSRPYVAT